MVHLPDLFQDPLIALGLLAVLVLFAVSVAVSIRASFGPPAAPNKNFVYVATAIAGLVLSVASGVLGAPAEVSGQTHAKTLVVTGQTDTHQNSGSPVSVTPDDSQRMAFRNLYTWAYIIAGLICLIVFMLPNTSSQDIVKQVGLSTLGFLIVLTKRL